LHNYKIIIPTEDPVRASNLFNKFFTNIGSKIKKSKLNYVENKTSVSFDVFLMKKINKYEILKILNNLKYDTAAGFDEISVKSENIKIYSWEYY